MSNKDNLTQLSELGEFGLIQRISEKIKLNNISTLKGVGDDAAVLDYNKDQIIVTSDMLLENVHFNLVYVPLKHLGYKAVMVNLSDVYAMNAKPEQITVAIAVSSRFTVEAIDALYDGILLACEKFGVDLVGGDTTSSQSGLIISITAIGRANKNEIVYRNTASKGDLVCVTGDLGGAYMGLQLLEREKEIFNANPGIQPSLDGNDYILGRQLKPIARGDIYEIFKDLKLMPTAMIDVSDGLSSEIMHIGFGSKLGAKIVEEKIPIAPETINLAKEMNLDPTVCAMSGGEDYELLFTINPDDYDKIKNSPDFTVIGTMVDEAEGFLLISRDGTPVGIESQGYNAFLKSKE